MSTIFPHKITAKNQTTQKPLQCKILLVQFKQITADYRNLLLLNLENLHHVSSHLSKDHEQTYLDYLENYCIR